MPLICIIGLRCAVDWSRLCVGQVKSISVRVCLSNPAGSIPECFRPDYFVFFLIDPMNCIFLCRAMDVRFNGLKVSSTNLLPCEMS